MASVLQSRFGPFPFFLPAPHFPSPPPAFVPWNSYTLNPTGETGVCPGKTPGAGLGNSVLNIRVCGWETDGAQDLTVEGGHPVDLQLPSTPPPTPLPLEPQRDRGGWGVAWRTGHPLGRTQDAMPEVPSPSQGHRGKRLLGLTTSKGSQCPDSQSKLVQVVTSRAQRSRHQGNTHPSSPVPIMVSQDAEQPTHLSWVAPASGPIPGEPHRAWGRPGGPGGHCHL